MDVRAKELSNRDMEQVLSVSRTALECNQVQELLCETLRLLEQVFETGSSNFFFSRRFTQALDFDRVVTRGIEDEFIAKFRQHYHRLDPFLEKSLLHSPPVLTTDQLISFRDLIRGEYYNDFLKPQAIHYQMSLFLRAKRRLLGILSVFRPRDANNFSPADRTKAELMAPYLAAALEKCLASEETFELKSIIDSLVSGLPYEAMVVLDSSLEPVYVNQSALEIFSSLRKVKAPRDWPPPLPTEICSYCHKILSVSGKGNGSESHRYQIDLVSATGKRRVSVFVRPIADPAGKPLLLVCIGPGGGLGRLGDELIKRGLSPRQIDVVSLLCKGLTNREIANQLFISEYTVENHLRSIYEKMKVRNRTSLTHKIVEITSEKNWPFPPSPDSPSNSS